MNSASTPHTSSNGRSFLVTCGPLQEQGMLCAIEQPALVLESETEDFGGLQCWPDWFVEPVIAIVILAGREDHVAAVFLVGVEPHPLVLASPQTDFSSAVILVLISFGVGVRNGDDAHSAARCHCQVKRMQSDADADCRQGLNHLGRDREVALLHPDVAIDHRHHRMKVRVGAEELVLPWYLADADGDDADGAGAFHARNILAYGAKLLFLFVELSLGNELEIGLLRLFVGHVGLLGLAYGGAGHDVTLPTRRVMISRSDSSAAFKISN